MPINPDLLAPLPHRAGGAARQLAGANVLAERDEQPVNFDPVLPRQYPFQFNHRLFRGSCRHVTPAISDPMHVDIDADPRLAAGNAERQVGALDPDAGEGEERLFVAGQLAAVFVNNPPGDGLNLQ